MQGLEKTKVLFIAGFGPIVRDADTSRKLYVKALDIPFKEESGGYLHTDALQGAKEFALWPLSQAAESCFGNSAWPDSLRPARGFRVKINRRVKNTIGTEKSASVLEF